MKPITSLRFDKRKCQFRRAFGKAKRKFWLGNDLAKALKLANGIQQFIEAGPEDYGQGWHGEWTPGVVKEMVDLKREIYAEADECLPKVPTREPTVATLDQAVDDYQAILKGSKGRSAGTIQTAIWRTEKLREILGGDVLVAKLDRDQLSKFADALVGKCKAGDLAYDSLKGVVTGVKGFLDWLEGSEAYNWTPPKRYQRLLKLPATLPRNDEDPRVFSVDELKQLWKACQTGRQRLYLLLGIQAGFLASDCASLTPGQIHVASNPPHIRRGRGKTGQPGRWALWSETVALVLDEWAARPECKLDEPLLLTEDGGLLVRYNDKGTRLDAIDLVWTRLLERAGMKGVAGSTFKCLRRTGSQLVRNLGGEEMSEAFLAHRTRGVGRHYNAFTRWTELGEVLRKVREQLVDVFKPLSVPAA